MAIGLQQEVAELPPISTPQSKGEPERLLRIYRGGEGYTPCERVMRQLRHEIDVIFQSTGGTEAIAWLRIAFRTQFLNHIGYYVMQWQNGEYTWDELLNNGLNLFAPSVDPSYKDVVETLAQIVINTLRVLGEDHFIGSSPCSFEVSEGVLKPINIAMAG